MVRCLGILCGALRSSVRTHRELALENLALRQQLAVWKARQPRPRLTEMDRIFWVVLSRLWKNWRSSLQVVRPETVVRWHRRGFRLYWAWKSRRRWGRPAIGRDLRLPPRSLCAAPPADVGRAHQRPFGARAPGTTASQGEHHRVARLAHRGRRGSRRQSFRRRRPAAHGPGGLGHAHARHASRVGTGMTDAEGDALNAAIDLAGLRGDWDGVVGGTLSVVG